MYNKMEEVNLHRVFFVHGQLDDIDVESIKKDCLKSHKDIQKLSNDVTDTKNEDLKISKSKEIDKIVKQIQKKFLSKYSQKIELLNFWAQVHQKYESTNTHDHVDCFDFKNSPDYSMVFYVQTPKDCGKLVFQYPINKYNQTKRWWFPSNVGSYVIFPATLDHFVTKNYSDDYRIALSFNFKIKN